MVPWENLKQNHLQSINYWQVCHIEVTCKQVSAVVRVPTEQMDHQTEKVGELTDADSFDALHGVCLDDPSGSLKLYYNRARYYRYLNTYFPLLALGPILAFNLIGGALCVLLEKSLMPSFLELATLVSIGMSAAMITTYVKAKTLVKSETNPIIELGDSALTVSLPGNSYNQIPWSTIIEAKVIESFGLKFVQVKVNNRQTLFDAALPDDRLDFGFTQHYRATSKSGALWYQLMGNPSCTFNIPETFLPIDAELLAEQINMRCGANAKLLIDEDGSGVSQL